jgi:hypothetical protein
MRGGAALVVACAVLIGCRATPVAPPDDMEVDMAAVADDLGGGVDAGVGDMACATVGPEVCGNGCDDDRNGYTDDDDPACTTQMLVTLSLGTPALWRLILEPTPHVVVLDGNPVDDAMAAYNRTFAPAAFLAYEGGTKILERRPLGGTATTYATSYGQRDACVFNGELIVVDPRAAGSLLHRFQADGMTELGTVPVANIATACSSDGNLLYVAAHPNLGDSVIHVFGKGASGPVDTTMTIGLPDALLNAGYTRLVDLVYVKKSHSFIGLFAMPGTSADSSLNGDVMAPFDFDGGVGGFIDGGVWHGAGEFLP